MSEPLRHLSAVLVHVLAALLLLGGASAGATPVISSTESSAPAPAAQLQGAALLAALQRGGHVLYFRHTATDFSRGDSGMRAYDDCANQRLLSAQGRADATAIGERIRALHLPVGEAYASPYCRTMEHAQRMLGQERRATRSVKRREATIPV